MIRHKSSFLVVAIMLLVGVLVTAQDSNRLVPASAGKALQDAAKAAAQDQVAQDSNQAANPSTPQKATKVLFVGANGPVGILTDTGGVDFVPYLRELHTKVSLKWCAVVPTVDYAKYANGKVAIEFTVRRDGVITAIKVVDSSGDSVMDRAVWAGVATSSPFAALPADFKGDSIKVRLLFHYNPNRDELLGILRDSRHFAARTASH